MSSMSMPRVRLSTPDEIVAAVPHLLGFHPSDSIVAIALVRKRLGFTMRLDLAAADVDGAVAEEIARRMEHAGAEAVLLVVYGAAPECGGALPRTDLVDTIQCTLTMPLMDAVLVAAGRCWSYLCVDRHCCPDDGRVVRDDSPGAIAVAAAAALQGGVVLPDRAALVATVQPVTGPAADAMRAALARAARRSVQPAVALRRIDRLCARYDEPPVTLADDEAARVALAMHHIEVRDVVLRRLVDGDQRLALLVRDVAWRAQPPDDAPISVLLAVIAYLRGDGVIAGAAIDRALDSDPDYGLAHLLAQSLHLQVEPSVLRAAWRADLP